MYLGSLACMKVFRSFDFHAIKSKERKGDAFPCVPFLFPLFQADPISTAFRLFHRFADRVVFDLYVPVNRKDEALNSITGMTAGKATVTELGICLK